MIPLARRLWLVIGVIWPACWLGLSFDPAVTLGAAMATSGLALIARGGRSLPWILVLVLGWSAGALAQVAEDRELEALGSETRSVRVAAAAVTDAQPTRFGSRLVIAPFATEGPTGWEQWNGPRIATTSREVERIVLGDRLIVRGIIRPGEVRVGRLTVAGSMSNPAIELLGPTELPLVGFANQLRARVLGNLDLTDPGDALLAGFLVGDTTGVSDADLEALRRAGLTHYVAVSGSNVATFLALWWLVLAPVARHPRLRAAIGLVGVVVFVVVTRAEPSVVRAGVMVSVVLVGRMFGWAFDRYTALAIAVLGCLSLAPSLAADVGFQLSVAATVGVMFGSQRIVFEPRPVATVVGATISAQVAVAPILLTVFGSLPALAPLANLVAAPLVSVSTVLGGLGALTGFRPLTIAGSVFADAVLWVGRVAAPWPQLGVMGATLIVAAGLMMLRFPLLRAPGAVITAVIVAASIAGVGSPLAPGTVVFLDVGQGDSELLVGDGFTVLIDGGPDPGVLTEKLADFGVDHVDLLIVSHVHADHIEGLAAVVGRMPIGAAWLAFDHQSTPASEWLVEALAVAGVKVVQPPIGTVVSEGGLTIEVLGPLRRYASPNDQSLVVEVTVSGRSHLFVGDIEVVAQTELAGLTADVLKVPHQGAATSDAEWLSTVAPDLAVISVGPNDFGHPADWVIDVLEASGATVMRTDRDGDVIVGPSGLSSPRPWWRLWP